MKTTLKLPLRILALMLIVAGIWFFGNYIALLPENDPIKAAELVADRHIQPKGTATISATHVSKEPVFPFGEMHHFSIQDGDTVVANVELYNFVNLGWQEKAFELTETD